MVTYRPRKRSSTDAKRKTPLPTNISSSNSIVVSIPRTKPVPIRDPVWRYNAPEANISNAVDLPVHGCGIGEIIKRQNLAKRFASDDVSSPEIER